MDKIDKYLLFQAIDNILTPIDGLDTDKEKLDSVLWDLNKIRKMVEDF